MTLKMNVKVKLDCQLLPSDAHGDAYLQTCQGYTKVKVDRF
jgi:hypothetical protein